MGNGNVTSSKNEDPHQELNMQILDKTKKKEWEEILKMLRNPPYSSNLELIKKIGRYGYSLLHIASDQGELQVIKTLIEEFGFDVDCLDLSRHTPIGFACASNKIECVEYLIQKGSDVNKGFFFFLI